MEPHIFKGTTHFLREPHVLPHYLCGSDIIVCCNWILLSYTLLFTANRHTKYLMCFMYAFLMSNETVLSVERFCTCLTFISHSIMDTSHMPLKWFFFFFAHWKHRLHCLHSSMVLTPLVADARLTESYLRSGSLYSLHDIPRDRWPFHFMLEPTLSFIPRCGRRPLCGSFHGGMRPPIRSFQYLVKDEFISWQGCQVGRRVHCRTL